MRSGARIEILYGVDRASGHPQLLTRIVEDDREHKSWHRTPTPIYGLQVVVCDLLAVTLDVTSVADAETAVRAAVDRFDRIDVLVNNAASFYAGYFEELTPEQIGQQLAASLIGPMNVTRAVLPVMRKQRSGHIISISSSAASPPGLSS